MHRSSGVGQILVYVISLIAISIVLSGIVWLLRSLHCSPRVGNRYEGFAEVTEENQLPETRKKIEGWLLESYKSLSNNLDQALLYIKDKFPEEMDTKEDVTCKIYKDIQDKFVKNKTEIQHPDEMDMSPEDFKRLENERIIRGKKQFEIRKRLFIASTPSKLPLYECFEDAGYISVILENNDTDLQVKMEELIGLLQSDEFSNRLNSLTNLTQTAAFNSSLLRDSINYLLKQSKTEGFKDYTFSPIGYGQLGVPVQRNALTETQLNYVATIQKGYGLINSFKTIQSIQNIDIFGKVYRNQNSLYDTLNAKKRDLESQGNQDSKTMKEFDASKK